MVVHVFPPALSSSGVDSKDYNWGTDRNDSDWRQGPDMVTSTINTVSGHHFVKSIRVKTKEKHWILLD